MRDTRALKQHYNSVYSLSRHSDRHTPWRTRECNLRSKIRWFTSFCNSHYLSQLATFFIDARAKRSTVRSFYFVPLAVFTYINTPIVILLESSVYSNQNVRLLGLFTNISIALTIPHMYSIRFTVYPSQSFGNDPSAGSPTETLLRLLLPLDKLVWASSQRAKRVAWTTPIVPIQRSH